MEKKKHGFTLEIVVGGEESAGKQVSHLCLSCMNKGKTNYVWSKWCLLIVGRFWQYLLNFRLIKLLYYLKQRML